MVEQNEIGVNVPELRFLNENGETYPNWNGMKLGKISKITTGKLDANAMINKGKYRFYTCAREYYYINNYAFDTDALIVSGNGANVGYIHHYNGRFNAYQRTYVLDKFDDNIIYIKYFLDRYLSKRIMQEKNEGNTPYIVMGTLSDMKINLPSLKEQQKIANFLSIIDTKIEKLSKKVDLLTEYKKGVMQKLFAEDESDRLRFLDENGEAYPKLRKVSLGEILSSFSDKNNTLLHEVVAVGKYGIKKRSEIYSKSLSQDISGNKLIRKDTLTIGMGSTQIDIGILLTDHIYSVSPAYTTFNINTKIINSFFLQEILKEKSSIISAKYMIIGARQGKSVDKTGLLLEYINLPSLKEQQKIANFLSSIDKKIELTKKQVELTKEFKKGLLQKMFV